MGNNQQAIDEWSQVLKIRFSQPILVENQWHLVKYNIVGDRFQNIETKTFLILLDSGGVSAFLLLKNNQHQLSQTDNEICEKVMTHLVGISRAFHNRTSTYREIEEYLRGLLNVQVSLDTTHENKKLVQTRGVDRQP